MTSDDTPPPAVAPTYDPNPTSDEFLTQEQQDEMLARRLQAEEEEALRRLQAQRQQMREQQVQREQELLEDREQQEREQREQQEREQRQREQQARERQQQQQLPPPPPMTVGYDKNVSDEEMARRVEMEMKDQFYAMQLQAYEQSRQQQRALQAMNNNNGGANPRVITGSSPQDARRLQAARQAQRSPNGCSGQRCVSALLMLVIVSGAAVLVLFYGSSIWDRFSGGGDLPPFFQWDETEDGPTGEEFKSWRTRGNNGLTLTIVNAMTEDWHGYFDEAVEDWNEAPALNLIVEMADEPDPACTYIRGKLKACNGEYGLGGWSGLNEAWLDERSFITASTAKMNESYLKGKGYSEKLYVTCHELGHGYGLPHRDVNANNIDLGTCLDYTTRFRNNMHPDETDFLHLEELYGIYDGRRNTLRSLNSGTRIVAGNTKARDAKSSSSTSTSPPIDLQNQSYKDGRLLYKSDRKEIYEQGLPDGGRKITTVLLAN